MKRNGPNVKSSVDMALMDLITQGIEKYQINVKNPDDIPDEHVDELFELTLDIVGGKQSTMHRLPKAKKLLLIKQITSQNEYILAKSPSRRPQYYVELLNSAINNQSNVKSKAELLVDFARQLTRTPKSSLNLKEIITELKVQCQCQSIAWLKQFIHLGGLASLFSVLESMHSKPGRRNKHYEIESETLKILRLIANSNDGITDILCQQKYLNILILSLDSPLLMARTATLDFLLAIVTLDYPKGHSTVMTAMEHFKVTRGYKRVFDCLVESLGASVTSRGIFGSTVGGSTTEYSVFGFGIGMGEKIKQPSEKDIREYLVSSVALVRFLVEIPPEYEYRMHLRHELITSGIVPIFQRLTTWAASEFHDILSHVIAFETLKNADFKYLLSNLDTELDIDINDPGQLLNLLSSKLNVDDNNTVTALIQNIVVGTILLDQDTRSYMLSMIEKAVMYIVLDQNGITNFTDAFKYTVDQIISGLQEIDTLHDENAQLSAICEHQEQQLLNIKDRTTDSPKAVVTEGVDAASLTRHRNKLEQIYKALSSGSFPVKTTLERTESDTTVLEVPKETLSIPAMKNVPPPPPLPPNIPGITSNGPPPPPPPFGLVLPASPKIMVPPLKYRPATRIRKIHWENVNADSYNQSVWSRLSKTQPEMEEQLYKSGILTEIDEAFKQSETKLQPKKPVEIAPTKETGMIKFLSEKRAQNIMIFLGTIKKITLDGMIDAIRSFNVSKLTETMLTQCKSSLPSEEETLLLKNYNDCSNLREAERFMIKISKIFRYQQRIDILIFKLTFKDLFNDLKLQVLTSLNALQLIKKSSNFERLLHIMLIVGNYMNSSVSNESIPGFRVSFLEKFIDIKSSSAGVSALQLICKMIHETEPVIADCIHELRPIHKLNSISFQSIREDLTEIQKSFQLLAHEVELSSTYSQSSLYRSDDAAFLSKLKEFHSETKEKVGLLKQEHSDLMNEVQNILKFFGEPSNSKVSTEALIGYLSKFLVAFENAYNTYQRQSQQKNRQPKQIGGQTNSKAPGRAEKPPQPLPEPGKLDSLLETLKSRPALQSFDIIQKRKQREIAPTEVRRFPRNTPATVDSKQRTASITKVEDVAWGILDALEFDEFKLDLNAVNLPSK